MTALLSMQECAMREEARITTGYKVGVMPWAR
jgi:hypothetical protein